MFDSDQEVERPTATARVQHAPLLPSGTASTKEVGEHESRKSLPQSARAAHVSDPALWNSPGHTTSQDQSSRTTDRSPNPDRKDRGAGAKSSDSVEEADKDFIFI